MSGRLPATYDGPGFRARGGTLASDVHAGVTWSARSVDSEFLDLREVGLRLPDPNWPTPAAPDAVLHLAPVDFGRARAELEAIGELYGDLGIGVQTLDDRALDDPGAPLPNAMFLRDSLLMTAERDRLADGRRGKARRGGSGRGMARAPAYPSPADDRRERHIRGG
jgi:hypothetical protein